MAHEIDVPYVALILLRDCIPPHALPDQIEVWEPIRAKFEKQFRRYLANAYEQGRGDHEAGDTKPNPYGLGL